MNDAELRIFQKTVLDDPITQDVWRSKYRFGDEASIAKSRARVVGGVYTNDDNRAAFLEALELVQRGILIPAGRVNAGAGTGRRVTLNNCYVNETVQDSMPGIARAIGRASLTLQQGGGIGTAWGTVRPAGAVVRRTSSVASGAIPFMRWMNAMAATAASAGDRRGAMMGTLPIDHPDLWNPEQFELGKDVRGQDILTSPSFLSVKTRPGELTFMNISVLVTDTFMKAVEDGADWDLGFHVPRADGKHIAVYDREMTYTCEEVEEDLQLTGEMGPIKGARHPWYVYRRLPARQLWDEILRTTYKYAEPGVIFIDRVNDRNNLQYCEDITCTNPCGEQPLGPNNVCCLGSVNLAFLVKYPFTTSATFDMETFDRAVLAGVRLLDNVLDVTNYPLAAQREASMAVRRIGLGVTGFGDAIVQMGVRYGSERSVFLARNLAASLQSASYRASVELAKERGPFPEYDGVEFGRSWNVKKLPVSLQFEIKKHGIRNGVLNTIAPNGTISLYVGNVSSGHEPVFSFRPSMRKVRQPDDTTKDYEVIPYSLRLYRHMTTAKNFVPSEIAHDQAIFVGAMDLTPEEHLLVHGAWQEGIDAAVSKTINCPASMSFEDFKGVYSRAYALGAKGCTTYRPDPESGRGSVLSETEVASEHVAVDGFVKGAMADKELANASETIGKFSADGRVVGRCPGCGADVWVRRGRKQICVNCHDYVLEEVAEPTEDDVAGAWRPEDLEPSEGPSPGSEVAHGAHEGPQTPVSDDSDASGPPPRPNILDGRTHKLKWPVDGVNWYVTVTNDGRCVRELFVAGGDSEAREWVEALARTTTAVLRRDGDVRFLADELERVTSAKGGAFIDRKYRPSVVAAIGGVLRAEIERLQVRTRKPTLAELEKILREESPEVFITPEGEVRAAPVPDSRVATPFGETCRKCGENSWVRESGCQRCLSCGEEVCG